MSFIGIYSKQQAIFHAQANVDRKEKGVTYASSEFSDAILEHATVIYKNVLTGEKAEITTAVSSLKEAEKYFADWSDAKIVIENGIFESKGQTNEEFIANHGKDTEFDVEMSEDCKTTIANYFKPYIS